MTTQRRCRSTWIAGTNSGSGWGPRWRWYAPWRLSRPYFAITSARLSVLRWCLEIPKWREYLALNSFYQGRRRMELLYAYVNLDGAAQGILWAAGLALILTWLWKNARRPLADPQK